MDLNWSYIAGFFDGEGCISFPLATRINGRGNIQCHMTQVGSSGLALFKELKALIEEAGIPCQIYHTDTLKYNPNNNPEGTYKLVVGSRNNCIKFLKLLYPWLRIKRQLAQDVIRYFVVFPMFSRSQCNMLRLEGMKVSPIRAVSQRRPRVRNLDGRYSKLAHRGG